MSYEWWLIKDWFTHWLTDWGLLTDEWMTDDDGWLIDHLHIAWVIAGLTDNLTNSLTRFINWLAKFENALQFAQNFKKLSCVLMKVLKSIDFFIEKKAWKLSQIHESLSFQAQDIRSVAPIAGESLQALQMVSTKSSWLVLPQSNRIQRTK